MHSVHNSVHRGKAGARRAGREVLEKHLKLKVVARFFRRAEL